MSEHHAGVRWTRTSADFTYDTYNRNHLMIFKDGAVTLPASAAAVFKGDASIVDPEETYIASLSSCHMLTFLAICAKKRLVVDSYDDDAFGGLEKGADGKLWMAHVTLRPSVRFAAETKMNGEILAHLHHEAHGLCFIALSVKTDVRVEPRQ